MPGERCARWKTRAQAGSPAFRFVEPRDAGNGRVIFPNPPRSAGAPLRQRSHVRWRTRWPLPAALELGGRGVGRAGHAPAGRRHAPQRHSRAAAGLAAAAAAGAAAACRVRVGSGRAAGAGCTGCAGPAGAGPATWRATPPACGASWTPPGARELDESRVGPSTRRRLRVRHPDARRGARHAQQPGGGRLQRRVGAAGGGLPQLAVAAMAAQPPTVPTDTFQAPLHQPLTRSAGPLPPPPALRRRRSAGHRPHLPRRRWSAPPCVLRKPQACACRRGRGASRSAPESWLAGWLLARSPRRAGCWSNRLAWLAAGWLAGGWLAGWLAATAGVGGSGGVSALSARRRCMSAAGQGRRLPAAPMTGPSFEQMLLAAAAAASAEGQQQQLTSSSAWYCSSSRGRNIVLPGAPPFAASSSGPSPLRSLGVLLSRSRSACKWQGVWTGGCGRGVGKWVGRVGE